MWLEERTGVSVTRLRAWGAARVSRQAARTVALASALLTLVAVQALTGVLLAVYYKPSWDRAHDSVNAIVTMVSGGWLVRGAHVWGAHLLVAGVLVHLARVFLSRRYGRPREVSWLLLLALTVVVLGEAATGQLLPLDESAIAGAPVAADIAGSLGLGGLVGADPMPGDAMLGRFFVAHTMVLPAAGLLLAFAHMLVSARHADPGPPQVSGADCAARGALGTLALLAIAVVAFPPGAGAAGDPLETPPGVRPLWPFLPVYQALKWLPSAAIALGALAATAILIAVPFAKSALLRRITLAVAVAVLLLGILGALAERSILGLHFDTHAIPRRLP